MSGPFRRADASQRRQLPRAKVPTCRLFVCNFTYTTSAQPQTEPPTKDGRICDSAKIFNAANI